MGRNLNAVEAASEKIDEVLKQLDTDPEKGLISSEVESRLKEYGENVLGEEKEETFFDALKEEAREPMILLLLGVGILYSVWGSLLDAVTIFTIIAVMILSEVYNEWKAEQGVESLKELTSPTPLVLRDGQLKEISAAELVPGDIMPLNVGERISADARLVKSFGLQIDESTLTGESLPVSKNAEEVLPKNAQIMDLSNMVLAGTLVVQGEGLSVVTSTGRQTELGRIKKLTEETEEQETPLQGAMEDLSKTLVYVALFFSILIPVLGYIRGQPLKTMVLTGLSLSFAVIPEELPIIVTMVLAVGTYALSKRGALVKRLRASETLGSVTVIAADKTGTITENVMRLGHIYSDDKIIQPSGSSTEKEILEIAVLATRAQNTMDNIRLKNINPMGAAILDSAIKAGIQIEDVKKRDLVNEFSFDRRTQMASYVYSHGNALRIYSSGAPEAVMTHSSKVLKEGSEFDFKDSEKERISKVIADLVFFNGERALGIAYKKIKMEELQKPPEGDLVFAGIVSFVDPPRPEVPEVVKTLNGAGIRVVMLTGDHPETAKAIATKVGIDGSANIITGPEISRLDDDQLKEAVKGTSIFARITPEAKLRIVHQLKENSQVVAVTGDGVNDAPALKEAAIGIAMGQRGTDAAKEAADMVLTDDNFVSIGRAVEEGRKIFDNLKKGTKYYLAVKVALVLIFLLPIVLDVPLPFAPIQIILLEMFMDIAASSGFVAEKAEPDLMSMPPRDPAAKILDRITLTGISFSALCLFVSVSYCYLSVYYASRDLVYAQTVAFSAWIVSHIFLAFVRRSEKEPLLKRGLFSNRVMDIWAILAIGMLVAVTAVPILQTVVKTTWIQPIDWARVIIASFLATVWIDIAKYFNKNK